MWCKLDAVQLLLSSRVGSTETWQKPSSDVLHGMHTIDCLSMPTVIIVLLLICIKVTPKMMTDQPLEDLQDCVLVCRRWVSCDSLWVVQISFPPSQLVAVDMPVKLFDKTRTPLLLKK